MALEIERKFLVSNQKYRSLGQKMTIEQGFLVNDPEKTVRIRVVNSQAFLTIKGKLEGMTRREFEYEIPLSEAQDLLAICTPPLIIKERFILKIGKLTWEVDEFGGENKGLIIAEVEIPDVDFQFELPDWVGEEVTSDSRYYNANLVKNPFNKWNV